MELSLFSEKTVETPYATFPEESELCEAWFAGNDCTLIKITYHGFCGTCATQAGEAGRTYRQAAENLSDTHSCSLNKGIGWESRTRKESLFSVCSLWIIECKGEGRIPKVAVFLKYCLPCRAICVRWKSVIGRAVMAPREGWSNAFVRGKILRTWIDKSEDLQTPKRRIGSMAIASYPHTFRFRFGAKRNKTQRRWLWQSSFFYANNTFHPYRAVPKADIARGGRE